MWFNRKLFTEQCDELLSDIEKEELKSPAWMWISTGVLIALFARCIKFKRAEGKPILAKVKKPKTYDNEE